MVSCLLIVYPIFNCRGNKNNRRGHPCPMDTFSSLSLFNLNLVIFQALLLSTYVDSMYHVRVTPLMNFTFSDDSLFLKKKSWRRT